MSLRRPLDPAAIKAANEKVWQENPELAGRDLTMDPQDAEYRREWIAAYESALPAQPARPNGNGRSGAPSTPCPGGGAAPCAPKPKITKITLLSLTFVSDHGLLKNHKTDWKNGGAKFTKPDWTPAVQNPISHTLDANVKLRLKLQIDPKGAEPETGTIRGLAAGGLVFEKSNVDFRPGVLEIVLTTDNKLAKAVAKLDFKISWSITGTSAPLTNTETQNTLFMTIGTPADTPGREEGINLKRMAPSVDLVGSASSLDPHQIVDYVFNKYPFYTLRPDPAVPSIYLHPTFFNSIGGAWPMFDFMANSGECQAIVRFTRATIKQVGCPGTADTVVVWADPDINKGLTVKENIWENGGGLNDKRKTVGGKLWFAYLADKDPQSVGKEFDVVDVKSPDYIGLNNFEACLRFEHGGVKRWYAGGTGGAVFDKHDEVIKVFHALCWVSFQGASPNTKAKIEEIVQRYIP